MEFAVKMILGFAMGVMMCCLVYIPREKRSPSRR